MMKVFAVIYLFIISIFTIDAGPPFNTDDPEPVEYKHWEFYISSISSLESKNLTGTLPHFEINYGLVPDVQIHIIAPLNYSFLSSGAFKYGYSTTELGIKYRFIHETENMPQVGTFPIIEVPTIKSSNFDGYMKIYIPLWLQKSYGDFSTYGGGGYWINRNSESKNQLFIGWQAQYSFSELMSLGGEVFYLSPEVAGTKSTIAINLGGFLNFSEKIHLLFSIGKGLDSKNSYIGYFGLLYTI